MHNMGAMAKIERATTTSFLNKRSGTQFHHDWKPMQSIIDILDDFTQKFLGGPYKFMEISRISRSCRHPGTACGQATFETLLYITDINPDIQPSNSLHSKYVREGLYLSYISSHAVREWTNEWSVPYVCVYVRMSTVNVNGEVWGVGGKSDPLQLLI